MRNTQPEDHILLDYKASKTRLISIVSKPIKVVVVDVVTVVLFVKKNVRSKTFLVKKKLGQKKYSQNYIG